MDGIWHLQYEAQNYCGEYYVQRPLQAKDEKSAQREAQAVWAEIKSIPEIYSPELIYVSNLPLE